MDATNGGLGSARGTASGAGAEGTASGEGAEGTASRAGAEGTASLATPDGAGNHAQRGIVGVSSAVPGRGSATRASDGERDAVLQRIQQAFAEGRLDDTEFDQRMRAALTARTHGGLGALLTDLPAAAAPDPVPAASAPRPGRLAIALKSSVRRAGRWRVPERYTTVVYKGGGWLDLRAAELAGPVTTFLAVAYKSKVTILAPPSARVEMTGFGVTQGADEEDPGYRLPADAPVIRVRGIAYKGAVEVTTRPPDRPALS